MLHSSNNGAEPHPVVHALQAPVADEQLPAEAEDAQAPVTKHAAQGQAAAAVEKSDSAAVSQGTAAEQRGQGESSAPAEAEQEAEPPPEMSLQAHEKGDASGEYGSVAVLQSSEHLVPVETGAHAEVEWEGGQEAEPSQQAQDSHGKAAEAWGGDEQLARAASLAAERKAEGAPEMSTHSHSNHEEASTSAASLPGGQPQSLQQGERGLPAAKPTGLFASAHSRRESTATEASGSHATPRSKLDEPISSPDAQRSGQLSSRPHTPGERDHLHSLLPGEGTESDHEDLRNHGGTLLSIYRSKELILSLQMGTLEPKA